jgi:hypothetical protein
MRFEGPSRKAASRIEEPTASITPVVRLSGRFIGREERIA